jgi:Domain of unknown function (DUF4136)
MGRYVVLLSVIFITGCAATQDRFCGLVEQDSYFLVSVARCETLQVSFDYDADTRFPSLDTYAWMPVQAGSLADSGEQSDGELHAWVTDAVDAKLVQQGFRLDTQAPDFLVSFNIPADTRGELSLAFVLANNQQFLWRGTAVDSGYPARNPDARELRIRMAVGRLLEQFPPSNSQ